MKNEFVKPKSNNTKVLVISEEIHNELEKARLEAQDNDEKEYDLSSFLKKLLKEHKNS